MRGGGKAVRESEVRRAARGRGAVVALALRGFVAPLAVAPQALRTLFSSQQSAAATAANTAAARLRAIVDDIPKARGGRKGLRVVRCGALSCQFGRLRTP